MQRKPLINITKDFFQYYCLRVGNENSKTDEKLKIFTRNDTKVSNISFRRSFAFSQAILSEMITQETYIDNPKGLLSFG